MGREIKKPLTKKDLLEIAYKDISYLEKKISELEEDLNKVYDLLWKYGSGKFIPLYIEVAETPVPQYYAGGREYSPHDIAERRKVREFRCVPYTFILE